MANLDQAFGLRPYKMLGGRPMPHGATAHRIQTSGAAGTTSVLYQGQAVIPLTTGLIDATATAAGGTVPWLGVFWGAHYIDLEGKPRFNNKWPGTAAVKSGSEAWAMVYDDPDMLFLINCDAAAADTIIHANANLATGVTGNATTNVSLGELAVSTANTTAALNLRIHGFDDSPLNNDPLSAGRLAIVQLNVHFYRATTGI
jgi:hypothetical protein